MARSSATFAPRPVTARWALEHLITCDAAQPGILRFTFQASPSHRQAIFLILAHLDSGPAEDLAACLARLPDLPTSSDPLQTVCTALVSTRVRDIVQALHPGVVGLAGALRKLGDAPMNPATYHTLVRILSDPDHRRAKVLRQLETITEFSLTAVSMIDPAFLFPDLIRRLHGRDDVEAFKAVVDLIRHIVPDVTDEDLSASLKARGPNSSLDDWAQRWVTKAVFPVLPPIQEDAEWVVLRTGEAMREAAERFRNCLRNKVHTTVLSRTGYVEWKPQPAIIELVALSGADGPRWALEGIYGPRNGRVDGSVVQAICRKLQATGVLLPARLGEARQFNRAAPLLSVYEFDDFGGVEHAGEMDEVDAVIEEAIRRIDAAA